VNFTNLFNQFGELTITGLAQGAIIALFALGYTLVYGVLRLINFAHSEVFTTGAFTAVAKAPSELNALRVWWGGGVKGFVNWPGPVRDNVQLFLLNADAEPQQVPRRLHTLAVDLRTNSLSLLQSTLPYVHNAVLIG